MSPVTFPRRATARWVLLALVAACLGCESRSAPVTVESGGLEIQAALEPASPRVGENRLWIEVRDADGQPIRDAELTARIHMHAMGAMPAMGGPIKFSESGEGRYRAEFSLEMGGTWLVEVRATTPSGHVARAEGSLSVGSPGLRLEGIGATPPAAADETPIAPQPGVHPAEFQIPPGRLQRIGVRTAPTLRKEIERSLRTIGRVSYDEASLVDVSLKVRGWVGELRIEAVGDPVERGAVLFTFYAPELYAAQEEYLQALRSQARAQDSGAPDRADYLVRSARSRLRLWDVAPADLDRLVRGGAPIEHLPIRSPATGFVIEKNVVAGSSVEPGERLYRIAPLERVWIEAEVYESDLPRVREGQPAAVTLSYLPDRTYSGTVAYVYPILNGATRTARVRIVLANPELELRPDMWATVQLQLDRSVRLMVPESAVLQTGERSFVFLDLGDGRFRPRAVSVGIRSGGDVEILSGLEEGERIVVSGTFLIASESRLRAALEQW